MDFTHLECSPSGVVPVGTCRIQLPGFFLQSLCLAAISSKGREGYKACKFPSNSVRRAVLADRSLAFLDLILSALASLVALSTVSQSPAGAPDQAVGHETILGSDLSPIPKELTIDEISPTRVASVSKMFYPAHLS